ncbi:hypothetical protein U1Q18_038959 [Sarracenia purpurea var. burkii]
MSSDLGVSLLPLHSSPVIGELLAKSIRPSPLEYNRRENLGSGITVEEDESSSYGRFEAVTGLLPIFLHDPTHPGDEGLIVGIRRLRSPQVCLISPLFTSRRRRCSPLASPPFLLRDDYAFCSSYATILGEEIAKCLADRTQLGRRYPVCRSGFA